MRRELITGLDIFPRFETRALFLLLGVILFAVAGCVQDAELKVFKCTNPVDPNRNLSEPNCDTTAASTSSSTSSSSGTVTIALIDSVPPQVAVIVNNGTTAVDLTGWSLQNADSSKSFIFSSLTLSAGGYVNVHTGTPVGTPPSTDLWSTTAPPWSFSSPNNAAYLKDKSLTNVVSKCDSTQTSSCWK